jgi:uncharacterized protein YehS (DUF1456 family)
MDNRQTNFRDKWNELFPVYQSANNDNPEAIKANFIVRQVEYNRIIDSLSERTHKDSVQHELILGKRGSGKSALLKRIEVELTENIVLRKKYIPVNLAEEQAGIYRLMDLWEQVLQELSCLLETPIPLKDYSEFTEIQDYTRYLYQVIHGICSKHKKKIVLLLDNFDRIVGSFSDDGNLLRETLINFNDLVIIAASARMEEHFWSYDKPFYEFFRRHHLRALSREETFELLEYWSDTLYLPQIRELIRKHPGKIENIRLLTDGLPRTIYFFMSIFLQNEIPIQVDFLKKIMDEATPLYQERLNHLTPPLRKIILEMAFLWEACSTKQLVEKCRMESRLVSAYLKTLSEQNIVDTIETDKRNHLYRISERFFNIWLIITQGNADQKRKVHWLSNFLESWYDSQDEEKTINIVAEPTVEYIRTLKKPARPLEDENRDKSLNVLIEYYGQNINKEEVRKHIIQYEGNDIFAIIIEIWSGIFNNIENRVVSAFSDNTDDKSVFIEQLLIHHQKSLVDKLFNHSEFGKKLQEQYTVLYYASQILNRKNDENFRKRIPPELESILKDVLKKIKEKQTFYQ